MHALLLSLVIGQWVGPDCSTGAVETQVRPATIHLTVDPPDGEVWLDDYVVQSRGSVRVLVSPPLQPGYRYSYRVKVRWGMTERQWTLAVEAGKTSALTLRPDGGSPSSDLPVVEQDGVKNFGIDREQLGPPHERITLGSKEITQAEAKKLLEAGSLTDDSGKLRLTIIGSEADRQRVLDDLKGPLADLASGFLVQSYAPDNWAVARAGFQTSGKPTIYVQSPSGKVLHRQDDYADGPDGLRQALKAIRKPDPNYDPTKDRDLRRPNADLSIWAVLGLAGVLLLLALRLKKPIFETASPEPGTTLLAKPLSLLDSLQGYKTKIAALVVAVLAANEFWHFVPNQYVSIVVYLAGALGLYGLRDAVERLKQRLEQMPTKT